MDLATGLMIVALVAWLGSLAGAVIATLAARRATRHADDLDDIAITVERLAKASRRDRMQRVRAAATETAPDAAPPAEYQPQGFSTPADRKAALRRKVAARGNGGAE